MPPDSKPDDRRFMREAIRLASRLPCRPWPNPPVGALVVSADSRVVGRGAHQGPGTPHAETVALDQAGDLARGSTLYCTLEPCNHHGRTAPCAPRVADSGIRRLVVGIRDPNPAVTGGGLALVRAAGIDVTLGTCGEEGLELAWPFVATRAFERPYVVLKTAASLDARFAPAATDSGAHVTGAPVYLTGTDARREVHRMRRWSDLVLVGARTLALDRPCLDARLLDDTDDCPAADPLPGYVDTDLSEEAPWRGRRYLVAGGREAADAAADRIHALRDSGAQVVLCDQRGSRVDPASLVNGLAEVGVHTVLLEGGPALARSFLAADLVDRWVSFVAPVVLGGTVTWPAADAPGVLAETVGRRFHLTRTDRCGGDARLVHDRVAFDAMLRDLTAEREA